jgi:hypothetical protein
VNVLEIDVGLQVHKEGSADGTQLQLSQPQTAAPEILPSRCLEDPWHIQNRLLKLLSHAHSAFKPFAAALSRAMFVHDQDDRQLVTTALESKGETWDKALRTNPDAINRRVRRYIPPPAVLLAALETLFTSWKDVPCSVDPSRGALFSTQAWKQARNILKVAAIGLISDPPGIPLYYLMGHDRNGLPYYRCIRGTNSVEGGVHMPLRRTFGSLRASPELGDSLLCNSWHRRNTTVSLFIVFIISLILMSISDWLFQSNRQTL